MEKLLTTKDLSKILKMTPISVSRLLKRENLGTKIGKRIFVKESDFEIFLEKNKQR